MPSLKEITKNITSLTTWLQSITVLEKVPFDELRWLAEQGEIRTIQNYNYLFRKGDIIPGTFIVIEGKFRLCVDVGLGMQEIDVFGPKDITGFLPYSRGVRHSGDGESIDDLTYLFISASYFNEMVRTKLALTEAMVHIMIDRVRHFSIFHQQNEKMLALGKLSAGLAHELNNPASAALRGAESLWRQSTEGQKPLFKFVSDPIVGYIKYADGKINDVENRKHQTDLTLKRRLELEDIYNDFFNHLNFSNTENISENLADAGFEYADLVDLSEHIPGDQLFSIFVYISETIERRENLSVIKSATSRISDLVDAVKSYTHMDQGRGKQLTDINSGLGTTLKLLEYKARERNIRIDKRFSENLPEILALPGELNTLWTNLIDNALDAMEDQADGIVEITTETAAHCIQISIKDVGPGIPANIKARIFDPFFTTKNVGKGVGLGLDIVNRIIRQHQGIIRLTSEPGQTIFTVVLPIR